MISVVIPNYNRTLELVRAVESVLNQTYLNLEIIIIDDNSDKDTKSFLFNNIKFDLHNKVKFYKNNKNIGAAASRNKGVIEANGKYIAFLDSDDYWEVTKLEKQILKFKLDINLDMVYCDQIIRIDNKNYPSQKELINKDIIEYLMKGWTAPNTSTLLYKKVSFIELGGFDENLSSCQDHDLWFRLALSNINIDFVNEPLSYFVQDSNDRISFNLDKRMNGVNKFLIKCKKYINNESFKNFKNNYIFKTSFPLFVVNIKKYNFINVFKIYFQYLILNKYFYLKLYEFMKR